MTLNKIRKVFVPKTEAVRGIDLDVVDGEFLVLVGPSGCGKSTTLRMIAGLEDATSGDIYIGDGLVNEVPAKDRDIAMVFQNYALYPHMTVFQNLSFGLRMRKYPHLEVQKRVAEAARILNIPELLDRRPEQLSGGQRQRVAMGRAMVRNPKVFLFDEPLSNLDAKLRVQLRTEIKRIHQKLRTTTIYVTHDQIEAMTLADRVVVMNSGSIEQVDTPSRLYHRPNSRFVAEFVGSPTMNLMACRLVAHDGQLYVRLGDELVLQVPQDREARYEKYLGEHLIFGIRPEHITEARSDYGQSRTLFDVRVEVVEPMGNETLVYFKLSDVQACARVDPNAAPKPDEVMSLAANMDHMHLISTHTDKVL